MSRYRLAEACFDSVRDHLPRAVRSAGVPNDGRPGLYELFACFPSPLGSIPGWMAIFV